MDYYILAYHEIISTFPIIAHCTSVGRKGNNNLLSRAVSSGEYVSSADYSTWRNVARVSLFIEIDIVGFWRWSLDDLNLNLLPMPTSVGEGNNNNTCDLWSDDLMIFFFQQKTTTSFCSGVGEGNKVVSFLSKKKKIIRSSATNPW